MLVRKIVKTKAQSLKLTCWRCWSTPRPVGTCLLTSPCCLVYCSFPIVVGRINSQKHLEGKEGSKKLTEHRPIILTSCLAKLHVTKLENFLKMVSCPRKVLNDRQFAYLPNETQKTTSSTLSDRRDCRRLPPVTAWSILSTTMDKIWACRDTHCPYLKIKLTKLSLNNLLDKFPPPSFL